MDNQNGYNYNGVVPNNQTINNSQYPNYGTNGQTNQVVAQPNYNRQVVTPTIQASPVAPVVSSQPSYAQQTQVPKSQNVSYPQVSTTNIQTSMSYPQTSPVINAQPTSYPQTSVVTQPQISAQPQVMSQQQMATTIPVNQNQQVQMPQVQVIPQNVPPVGQQSVPTNPIVDLNQQVQVPQNIPVTNQPVQVPQAMPQNVNTMNQSVPANPIIDLNPPQPEIPSIFVPDPELEAEFGNNEESKKKKFSIPKLSKKQLMIVAVAVVAVALIVVLSTVLGKGKNGGNTPTSNDNSNNNSNTIEENKTANDLPMDNWKSYKFEVNGKQLSLPISYNSLASSSGFTMKTNYKDQNLEKNTYMSVNLYKNKKLSLFTEIYNNSNNNIKLTNGNVTKISQTYDQVKKGAEAVIFPANLKVGMEMTKDSLIELLGNPSEVKNYSSNDYVNDSYMYYETNKTSVNYYEVKIINNVIEQITLDHRG